VQGGSDTARPRLIRTVLPDKLTAVTAAQAIAAALVAKLKTGKGQHVRLSMLDAVLAFLWASDMGLQTFVGQSATGRTAASFIDLIYETQNGFMTVAVMSDKEWAALTRALGRPEWLDDERFKTPALRDQNIDARLQLTQDVLKLRTTEEWLERLEAEGVPCAPVLTRDQVLTHPQVLASGILMESEHPVVGHPPDARRRPFAATPTTVRCGARSRRAHLRGAGRAGTDGRDIARRGPRHR
jgi:crotonobetainyl-CoA:carnitine CoA-transferase CaiB-like acyl-CoA transferase